MTEKTLLKRMFAGCYLKYRRTYKRKSDYCLYDIKGNPLQYISPKTFRNISGLIKINKGRITLNLREVRKLHGNTLLKKEYKKSKKHDTA